MATEVANGCIVMSANSVAGASHTGKVLVSSIWINPLTGTTDFTLEIGGVVVFAADVAGAALFTLDFGVPQLIEDINIPLIPTGSATVTLWVV